MKSVKLIFATLLLTVMSTVTMYAQSSTKVIAVVVSADWCSVCKANGARAMGVFMENNKDAAIQFVSNDLSNADTKKKSAGEIEKLGLSKAMKNYNATGVVYFFNAKTKEPISQITVANSNEEIAFVIAEVKKTVK